MKPRNYVAAIVLTLALSATARQTQLQAPTTTITTTTRLVLVDVIITDNEGRPVTDLQESDFVVLENGKPQKIASFARLPEGDKPLPVLAPLPPDVFTNDPRYNAFSRPPVIVLLDLLNTPLTDRPNIRASMIEFIRKQLRPGQPTAVFLLGRKLTPLQNFTSDPRILLAAMDRVSGNPPQPIVNRSGSEMLQDKINRTSERGAQPRQDMQPRQDTQVNPLSELTLLQEAQELAQRFEAAAQIATTTNCVEVLLQATSAISRAAQGIPGRKSLVWLSGGFAVAIPNKVVAERYPTSQEVVSFAGLLQRIAANLNEAQIAVYPVDMRGLTTTAPLWTDVSIRRNPYDQTRGIDTSATNQRTAEFESFQDSLTRMAQQTGGRAFLNRNDEDTAIATAVDDGRHYYVLGYHPEDKRWNGKFRKIELKVARKGLNLRYRSGYFADDPAGWQKRADWDLANALQSDPVTTAWLVFSGRASTPAPGQAVNVEFLLPPSSIHFEQQKGTYLGSVEFHVAALTNDDKVALTAAKTSDLSLDPQKYAQVMSFPSLSQSVPLALTAGKYRLRLLIRDNLTGNLGSVEIPITVPKK